MAPISPAIHLGAERVLVIEARRMKEPPGDLVAQYGYPSLAQIAGHALSSMFLDALPADIERLRRINRTLALLPAGMRWRSGLKPIDILVIAPSQSLDIIAARHVQNLPRPDSREALTGPARICAARSRPADWCAIMAGPAPPP